MLAELEGLEDELEMVDEEVGAPVIPTQPQQQAQTTAPAATVPEAVFNFPSAPQGQLQQPATVKETEDERAIRELQESMLA